MKIFILLGHPNSETLSGILADTYEQAAKAAGHEVRRANIGDLKFDPILHKGYKVIQDMEDDLKTVQENISWSQHFVLVYPNWWGGMPALLKGFWIARSCHDLHFICIKINSAGTSYSRAALLA